MLPIVESVSLGQYMITGLCSADVTYFAPASADGLADHEAIIQNIIDARRKLKSGMAVSFFEHRTEIGQALREASLEMPTVSLLLDEDAYDGFNIQTFANIGFSNAAAGRLASARFQAANVEVPPSNKKYR